MGFFRSNGDRVPQAVEKMAEEVRGGRMDRREFLAIASAMGASTAVAYGMIGMAVPSRAPSVREVVAYCDAGIVS